MFLKMDNEVTEVDGKNCYGYWNNPQSIYLNEP